jgi:nicotinamidase-related amidase
MNVPAGFFERCVFLSVDFQAGTPDPGQSRGHVTAETLPHAWRELGRTPEDVNAATDYAVDVALPNACRVAGACRRLALPMIFVHWGFRFRDGIDLDPEIYGLLRAEHGDDPTTWPHHIDDPNAAPARQFGVRDGEYVIAKSGQDAFTSSNLGFVLENLGAERIVSVGGHTGACHGKTIRGARRRGYSVLVVEDATFDAFVSTRKTRIEEFGYDFLVDTDAFVALAERALTRGDR